eukprot:g39003.t1
MSLVNFRGRDVDIGIGRYGREHQGENDNSYSSRYVTPIEHPRDRRSRRAGAEVKDTETSALPTEATDQGVDGGDAGVVRGVQAELKTRGALLTLLPPEWKTRGIGMVCRFHGMGQL